AFATLARDLPVRPGHRAGRDRGWTRVSERVADASDLVTHRYRCGLAGRDRCEVGRVVQLEQGQVGGWVHADDGRRIGGAAGNLGLDLPGALDDVVVGE